MAYLKSSNRRNRDAIRPYYGTIQFAFRRYIPHVMNTLRHGIEPLTTPIKLSASQ